MFDQPLELRVEADVIDDLVRFSIADNGPGIPLEFHARVFDVFVTLNSPLKTEPGLNYLVFDGSAVAKEATHGLNVRQTKGTTVSFSLPRGGTHVQRKDRVANS